MNPCESSASPEIELYFYDELDAAARARVETHLQECRECRRHLDDLGVIRTALAGTPRVDAPPAAEWSGFMRRLDERCDIASPRASTLRTWAPLIAAAAIVELLIIGVFVAARLRQHAAPPAQVATAQPAAAPRQTAASDRLLREQTDDLLQRSKLVVLGLAARDAQHTAPPDWDYERTLAGSLLEDTRLFRLAAQKRGLSDVASTMGDLETVLLEASLSDDKDPEALARVQRLIHKRDLLLKMQVASSGI